MEPAIRRSCYRVGTLMLLVAIAALALAGERLRERWVYCRSQSSRHADLARRFLELDKNVICIFPGNGEALRSGWRRMAGHHSQMSERYQRLAARPWLNIEAEPLPPDPALAEELQEQLEQERRDKLEQERAERLCKQLVGYAEVQKSFEVERVRSGIPGLFRVKCLILSLKALDHGIIDEATWLDPLPNELPQYTWRTYLQLHAAASQVLSTHSWLVDWKSESQERAVELEAFGNSVGDSKQELEQFVLPAWREAGLPGEPDFSIIAHREDKEWATIYFSRHDPRALITTVTGPVPNARHCLDRLDVYFHPNGKRGEKYSRYAIVEPSGGFGVRTYAGAKP